jgi:hypothetical protein
VQPPPSPCARLIAALPDSLDGHERRETRPRPDATAAWGDPPIVLRCGVGVPAAYRPTSQLFTVNGVDWFSEELSAGYLFTTIGRRPGVELSVPDDYRPEINPLADLSVVLARELPAATATRSTGPAPTTPAGPPAPGTPAPRRSTPAGTSTSG